MPDRDWNQLTLACREAMACAAIRPGRYGGRYVAWSDRARTWIVLWDDDPELFKHDESLDIYAQCLPGKVQPIARAREYLQADGTVVFPEDR